MLPPECPQLHKTTVEFSGREPTSVSLLPTQELVEAHVTETFSINSLIKLLYCAKELNNRGTCCYWRCQMTIYFNCD